MAVHENKGIVGIRLLDSRDNEIVKKHWNTSDISKDELKKLWVDKDIGRSEKIIGYKASISGNYISRFAWMTWEP